MNDDTYQSQQDEMDGIDEWLMSDLSRRMNDDRGMKKR